MSSPKYKEGDRVKYLKAVKSSFSYVAKKEEKEGTISNVSSFPGFNGLMFFYDILSNDDDEYAYDINIVSQDDILGKVTSMSRAPVAPVEATRPELSYVQFPEAGLKPAQATPRVVPPAQATPRVVPPAQATPRVVPPAQATPRVVPPAQATPRVVPPAQAAAESASESIYTVLPLYDTEFKEIEFEMQGETVNVREILFEDDESVEFSKYKYNGIDILIVNPLEKKNIKRNCLIYDNKGNYLVFSIQTIQDHVSRDHAVVFCYDTEYNKLIKNTYYRSNSEGGFWRYCISREGYGFLSNPNAYYKGYNYTTTSFINFNIQMFLFKNTSEYNKIRLPNIGPINCVSYTLAGDILAGNILERFNRNEGDGAPIDETHKQYISKEHLFNLINIIFPHVKIFENYNDCIRILRETLDRIREEPQNTDNQNKETILRKLYSSLGEDRRLRYGRNLLQSPQDNYLQTNPDKYYGPSESIGRREFYTEVYNVFSDLLEEYFVFLERESTKIMEINNYKLESFIINMTIFKNKIRSKITGEVFRIIYIKFNILGNDIITKMILNITPERNTLTPLGLDNIYVTAGSLIYKLFEYSQQANITFVGEAPSFFRRPTYTSLINVVNIRWLDRVTPL